MDGFDTVDFFNLAIPGVVGIGAAVMLINSLRKPKSLRGLSGHRKGGLGCGKLKRRYKYASKVRKGPLKHRAKALGCAWAR